MQLRAAALITTAALALGGVIWFWLLVWQRHRPLSVRSVFPVLLVIGILGRLAYVFFTPIFYAPDEQSHFNYIRYIAENQALPVQAGKMGESDNEWEYFQPPLYYLSLVPVYKLTNALFHGPTATVIALRLTSFLLWLINIRLGMVLLKRLAVTDQFLWLSTLALICLLPTYVFVSSCVNNDNLLITLSAGLLCLVAQQKRSVKNSIAVGILLGLALWVKQSAVVFFPAVGFVFLLLAVRRDIAWGAALGHGSLVFGLAVLFYFPWALRNWYVYGTFAPEDLSAAVKTWPSMIDGLISAAHNLAKTFWSVSGISNDIGYPFPLIGFGYGLVAMAGLAISWKQNPKLLTRFWLFPQSSIYLALGLAILVNVVLVLRFGYLYGMGQGRHLFPLLYPIALLLAWGIKSIPATNAQIHVAGFWVTYAIAFEAFSFSRFPTH